MIKGSEMDQLSTPWAMVKVSRLLSQCGAVMEDLGAAGDGPSEQGDMALELPMN